jgi:hypothetical protein
MLQNPEVKKKMKYQLRPLPAVAVSPRLGLAQARSGRIFMDGSFAAVGIVSVLTGNSILF